MSVNIFYSSMTGNTEELAELIKDKLSSGGYNVTCKDVYNLDPTQEDFDTNLCFIGSYTWNQGDMPSDMRLFLKKALRDKDLKIPNVAVFGTGDSQFKTYCRTVDELEYHLSKHATVLGKLKIEQSPRGYQEHKVEDFLNDVLRKGKTTCQNYKK